MKNVDLLLEEALKIMKNFDLLLEEVLKGGTARMNAVPELIPGTIPGALRFCPEKCSDQFSYIDITDSYFSIEFDVYRCRFGKLYSNYCMWLFRSVSPVTVNMDALNDSLRIALKEIHC